MKIKVTEQNLQKIQTAIDAVQDKARVRTIDADDVFDYCERISDIYRMIPKKNLSGSEFSIDNHAQNFPNAYKGIPESTQFTLLYKSGNFYLTDVARRQTQREYHDITARLSEEARASLLDAYTTPVKHGL